MAGRHLRDDASAPAASPRRWWLALVAALAGVAIGLGGASWVMAMDDDGSVVSTGADGADGATSSDGSPASDASARATPDAGPVTLAFVGDIYAEGVLADRLAERPDDFVGPFADVLRSADLVVGNVEAAIAVGGTPLDKDFVFSAPPSILDALAAGGVDVVSAANNHAIDLGPEGLAETLQTKASWSGGALIGIGANEAEAYAPHVVETGGQTIAVIAATQVIDADLIADWTATESQGGVASAKRVDRLVAEVSAARDEADTVVVFVHWGVETEACPDASQQELARALVDAGADVIVGTHAHRVQGAGRLGDAFVGYGTGNFLFGAPSEDSATSGVLLVEVDGREITGYEWRPGRIDDAVPQPLEGDEAAAAIAEWDELRSCTDLQP